MRVLNTLRTGVVWVAATLLLGGCSSLRFYAQAARGQGALLVHQRSIKAVVRDPKTDPALATRLRMARDARRFASATLGLPDNRSYTRYVDLHRPYVVWNVFVAPAYSVEAVPRCYPIAGCVAYRGWFSAKAAQAPAFVNFVQADTGTAALRKRAVLPYAVGSALSTMDTARRERILAETGAHRPTPLSAPGATYAARAAVAPTSPDTLAAKLALDRRNAEHKAAANSAANASPSATVDAAPAAATVATYTVVKGDTLSGIAKAHGVSVEMLRQWNHLRGDNLKLGQSLRLGNP